MAARTRRQFSLSQWALLVAALAVLQALFRPQSLSDLQLVASLVGFVTASLLLFAGLNLAVELTVGIQCPACSRFTLRRLARARRLYGCVNCGTKYRREGLVAWRILSDPAELARFDRHGAARRRWGGFRVPDLDGANTATGRLLRGKRQRLTASGTPRFGLESFRKTEEEERA